MRILIIGLIFSLTSQISIAEETCDVMLPLPKIDLVLHVNKCKVLKNGSLHSGLVTILNFKNVNKESDPVQGMQIMAAANCQEKKIRFEGYVISDDMFSENPNGKGIKGVESSIFQPIKEGTLGEKINNILCEN